MNRAITDLMATVLRDSNDAIVVQDLQGGILAWNRGAERMYGYSEAEALNMRIDTLTSPGKVGEQKEFVRRLMTGAVLSSFETQRVTRRGEVLDVWLTATKLVDDAGKVIGIVSTERDITARKRSEAALHASELQYRRLFESAKDGILILDAYSGMVVDVNPFLINLLGISQGEFLGKKLWELGFFRNIVANQQNFRELQEKEYIRYENMPLEASDGRQIDVEFVSNVYFVNDKKVIQCNIRDISERKRVENALRQSEDMFRLLFEHAADSILFLEVMPEGSPMIREANSAAFRCLGYERDELIGKTVSLIAARYESPGEVEKRRRDVLSGAGRTFEDSHRCKDGTIREFQCSVTEMQVGTRTLAVSIERDITERKRAEDDLMTANIRLKESMAELQRTQNQVIQQERMKALGEMVSGIAHDFNNNLMPILGFSDLLISAPQMLANRTETLDMLETIRTAALDAQSTVRRLREFYRPEDKVETAEVDLCKVIEKVMELTRPAWKIQAEGSGTIIRMETDVQPLPLVMANESQLREVLVNIVLNAIHAMPQGGLIRLLGRVRGDEEVTISVQDTGGGMTDEVRRKCLEPFFTTRGPHGSGLGLSMCYGIVQRHGGSLEVESEIGKGTTVSIHLPLSPPNSVKQAERSDNGDAVLGLRVLVVDDDVRSRELVGKYLEADCQTVVLASSADEALKAVDAGSFDLVMTDQAMPDMNGNQLAKAIKKKHPSMPIIMVTGFDDKLSADAETRRYVDCVVGKPTTKAELRHAVALVMKRGDRSVELGGTVS